MPPRTYPSGSKLNDPQFRIQRASKAARARTTIPGHVQAIRKLVDESRRAQGLPEHITDALTLAKVVSLLRLADDESGGDA